MMLHAQAGIKPPHMSMQACTRCLQCPPSMLAPAGGGLARPAALGMLSPAGGMLRSGIWTDHWHAADRIRPGQTDLLSQQRLLWSTAVASRLQPLKKLRCGCRCAGITILAGRAAPRGSILICSWRQRGSMMMLCPGLRWI